MNTKIYIAGKITGEDYQSCFDKFNSVENTLTKAGYQVVNPLKIIPKGTDWDTAMDKCKPHVLNADVILFLSDWKDSQGAQLERHWALKFKKRIIDYENISIELLETMNL